MVSTQKKKASKSKKAPRRVFFIIRHGIPYNEDEVVTRVKVLRKSKGRVITKSTKVVVPIVPSAPPNLPPPPPSEHDTPPTTPKQARKGPSRSVAVCISPLLRSTCQHLQEFRQFWNNGFNTGTSLLTNSSGTKHCIWELSPPVRRAAPAMCCSVAWIASHAACFVKVVLFTSTRMISSTGFRYLISISYELYILTLVLRSGTVCSSTTYLFSS